MDAGLLRGLRGFPGQASFYCVCWNIQENRAQTAFEPCGDHSKDNSQEGIWLLLFCWLTASAEDALSQLASEGCGNPRSTTQSIQKTPCWDSSPFLLHHASCPGAHDERGPWLTHLKVAFQIWVPQAMSSRQAGNLGVLQHNLVISPPLHCVHARMHVCLPLFLG